MAPLTTLIIDKYFSASGFSPAERDHLVRSSALARQRDAQDESPDLSVVPELNSRVYETLAQALISHTSRQTGERKRRDMFVGEAQRLAVKVA